MRVFITGASGWIGSAAVDAFVAAGHEVTGLVRSDAGAAKVEGRGAAVLRGDLDDLDSLRRGAESADAVVHLANKHDWSDPAGTARAERAAVETLVNALAGTDRPLLVASGVAGLVRGRPALETDPSPFSGPDSMRGGTENLALDAVDRGVRAMAARFAPTVHGTGGDHGFIAEIAKAARRHGVSGYIGDGTNAWSAVHVRDAGELLRLAAERGAAGTRLHAVAEEAVPARAIAEAIGAALGLPVVSVDPADADAHFGFIGRFFGLDLRASGAETRQRFGWHPAGSTLLEDIAAGGYPGR